MKAGVENLEFIVSAIFLFKCEEKQTYSWILGYMRMLTLDYVQASFKDLFNLVILYVNNWEDIIGERHSLGKRAVIKANCSY